MALKTFLVATLLVFFMISCSVYKSPPPKAINGVIDLKNWNWNKQGTIDLDGEWKYIRNTEDSDFIRPLFDDSNWENFSMPEFWQTRFTTSSGFCYFRLKVNLNNIDKLGIYFERVYSSYMLYINGEEILHNGMLVNKTQLMLPKQIPHLKKFEKESTILITIKLFNFNNNYEGDKSSPKIGLHDQLVSIKYYLDFLQSAILGILFVIGLYHLFLWLRRKEDKAGLNFSLFCFFLASYLLKYSYIIPELSSSIEWNIFLLSIIFKDISLYMACIFGLRFFSSIYPEDFSKKIIGVFQILSILLLLFSVVLKLFGNNYQLYDIYLFSLCPWIVHSLIMAIVRKRKYALTFLIGFLILLLSTVIDYLSTNKIIPEIIVLPYGMIIFVIFQSLIITDILIQAYNKSEYLSHQLKITEKYKSEFFQNVSHEIRTPLTLILTTNESTLNGLYGPITSRLKQELEFSNRNSHRIIQLVSQILDLSKIDDGMMSLILQPTNIKNLIKATMDEFKPIATHRNIKYQFLFQGESFIVNLDPVKMDKILYNLLSNAFKFTPSNGKIKVELQVTDKSMLLIVKDSGIGIPKEELENIFERFHQVDGSLTRQHEGSGIGLSIVKEFVKLHNGEISVNSSQNAGSEFIVTIPLNLIHTKDFYKSTTAKRYPESEYSPQTRLQPIDLIQPEHHNDQTSSTTMKTEFGFKQYSILFVEDSLELRNIVNENFQHQYKLLLAANGQAALNLLKTMPKPDIIVSDIMMPEMDGYTFFKKIQKNRSYRDIPFIFLTAKAKGDEKLKGLSLGAIDYISKPFSINELQYKIKSIIENNKLKKVLFEKNKYATIEKLIEGLSHEMLNPIGNIMAPLRNLEIFLENQHISHTKGVKGYLNRIFTNLERITKIIKSFKILLKRGDSSITDINLKAILNSIHELFSSKMKMNIIFSYKITPQFKIKTNQEILTQILNNLISNAIDAIRGKGSIIVEAYMQSDIPFIKVKDNGIGIKNKNIDKIFYPFFTEKADGSGTGLGLYFVKEMIIKNEWEIFVYSKEKEGTEFIIKCYPETKF